MNSYKIHICFNFVNGPWGGGNQFLKSLRAYFMRRGIYENIIEKADVIFFNSHHQIENLLYFKRHYPEKKFIHRVDGPVFIVRGCDKCIDKLIFEVNSFIADGTIFQSNWSREKCFMQGMRAPEHYQTITNAPDPNIFYPKSSYDLEGSKKKIIATSWSSNIKKGFDVYKYLDENLDFKKYDMTFVGNSLVKFNKIRHINPLPSVKLAAEIRKHDIFITASLDDPCSNSLIEALHCGLPVVVRNSGGHPEIAGKSGVIFNGTEDVCYAIDMAVKNYSSLVDVIATSNIDEVGKMYYDFSKYVSECIDSGIQKSKKLTILKSAKIKFYLKCIDISSKMRRRS